MHMADALISPAVGGTMWVAMIGAASYAAKKVKQDIDERKVPLMGVLGAFVFAAQMINFSIPGTGSSGHLCGGLLLSILLGPHAAFLTIVSIISVQALFFADGGLLALGSNIINMGFLGCYVGYLLIYKPLVGDTPSKGRLYISAIIASVVSLQIGAFGVVLETFFSGITELPFTTFLLLMQPIHLAIGFVEGLITATVILFIMNESPEIIKQAAINQPIGSIATKRITVALMIAALVIAGALSWFASSDPDGLEWSVANIVGENDLKAPEGVHSLFAELQDKIAIMPDYNFKNNEQTSSDETKDKTKAAWPSVDTGTSIAGILGSIITLGIAYSIGKGLQHFSKPQGTK